MNETTETEALNLAWHPLYKIGGAAAALMAVFIPIQVVVFILWPSPTDVTGWFALFQNNKLIGLLDLDLMLIVDQVFMLFIFLALYIVLRKFSQSFMVIGLALGLVGTTTYFSSGSAFEMLSLSNQYAAATTESQRAMLLSAGHVMIANYQGTAFNVAYVFQGVALLIIAIIMLRSTVFGKATAYVAVVLGVMSLLPPTAGIVGMFFALGSLIPLEIWDILIARRLFHLAK
ncbi:MAG: hypothetical protein KGJ59_01920 [Bacteroidota bacterium]|nr:hypothetical protein [Bacteroidota bacterium]